MKVVYLMHALNAPTREGIESNRQSAALWGAWLSQAFNVAISADWIWLSGVLSETQENREWGLACDKAQIEGKNAAWGVGKVFSSGMTIEAQHARSVCVPVFDLTGIALGDYQTVRAALARGGWTSA